MRSGKLVAVVAVLAVFLIVILVFGWRTYNQLVDSKHFLDVAHGRLLVEMRRKQDVLAGCRNAVAIYAGMEERIQARLITLNGLTKTHGPESQIVKSEGSEILELVREVDLLVEGYPGLKSKGPYVLLMETIQETGLRVTTERINYNGITYNYDLLCRLFPSRIVATLLGFREQPFLLGPLDYSAVNHESLQEN